jgi:hypothetical protein
MKNRQMLANMDKKEKEEKRKQLLKKIGKYSTAAGAVLLTGNLANAQVHLTTTNIDLTFGNSHGIDFDGDGLNELNIYVYTSIYNSSDPAAFIYLGNDPDATYFQVIDGGPYDTFGSAAALPLNRKIGPTLDSVSSYWSSGSWDAIAWTYFGEGNIFKGNFAYYTDQTRYMGVRFTKDGGSNWYYGWIGIQINSLPLAKTGTVGNVIDYAYQTSPNTGLLAGSSTAVPLVPIASAIGLGLAGLFGVIRSRRKKLSVNE